MSSVVSLITPQNLADQYDTSITRTRPNILPEGEESH